MGLKAQNERLAAENAALRATIVERKLTVEKLTRRILALESTSINRGKKSQNSHQPRSFCLRDSGLLRRRKKDDRKDAARWSRQLRSPRLAAVVSALSGRYRLSRRQIREALTSIFGIDFGLESVINVEQRVSRAIAPVCEKAALSVKNAPVVHADETGWFETASRSWLWSAATSELAVFRVSGSRSADAARRLLSDDFSGTLVTDRWGAYNWISTENRQFCWAHLLRDFKGWEEDGGRGASYGARLHRLGQETIHLWNNKRKLSGSRSPPHASIAENQPEIYILLQKALDYGSQKIRRTSQHLLSQKGFVAILVEASCRPDQ